MIVRLVRKRLGEGRKRGLRLALLLESVSLNKKLERGFRNGLSQTQGALFIALLDESVRYIVQTERAQLRVNPTSWLEDRIVALQRLKEGVGCVILVSYVWARSQCVVVV